MSKRCNHRDSNGILAVEFENKINKSYSKMFCILCGRKDALVDLAKDSNYADEENKRNKSFIPHTITQYECMTCNTKMICISDVVTYSMRLDFLECPKCKSRADIEYHPQKNYITKFIWWRD